MHQVLRPAGVLLDVRPAQQHPWVELVRGGGASATRLGQIDDSYRHGTLACANAALQTVIETGRFMRERAQTFTFMYQFDCVQSWLAYMAEHWSSARLSVDLLARVREEQVGAGDAVRVLRAIHAQRLRRL
jgi:hypothetical protein